MRGRHLTPEEAGELLAKEERDSHTVRRPRVALDAPVRPHLRVHLGGCAALITTGIFSTRGLLSAGAPSRTCCKA